MSNPASCPLDRVSISLIESGCAAKIIAAADQGLRPTLVHAYACRVEVDGGRVFAILARSQSRPVLERLATSRRIALVVCHIETYQTVQIKGDDANVYEPTAEERLSAAAYCAEFVRFASSLGYPAPVMAAHMACSPDDAIGVQFTVNRAFIQTPGPSAGQPLGGRV